MRSASSCVHAGLRDDAPRELPPGPAARRPGPGPVLDHLWVDASRAPRPAPAFPAERDDLLRGDIPAGRSRPGSRDLWCHGDADRPSFAGAGHGDRAPAPPPDERRGARRGSSGWSVRRSRHSPAARAGRPGRCPAGPPRADIGAGAGVDAASDQGDGFLAAARAIGDHLDSVALRDEREAAWVGLVASPGEGYWSLLPLGLDLYDGHPGRACSSWPTWAR